MSLFVERNLLSTNNPFIHRNINFTKTSKKNPQLSSSLIASKNNEGYFLKEPLDYSSDNSHQSNSDNYLSFLSPKKDDILDGKTYLLIKSKPLPTLEQVNLKKIKISQIKKITEKYPKNELRNSISFPVDSQPSKTLSNKQNIVISKTNTQFKINDSIIRLPMDNFFSSPKNNKNNANTKNNNFSEKIRRNNDLSKSGVTFISQVKIPKEKLKDKNRTKDKVIKLNLNEEKLKKIKMDKPRDRPSSREKMDKNNKKKEEIIEQKKEKRITKVTKLIDNKINNNIQNIKIIPNTIINININDNNLQKKGNKININEKNISSYKVPNDNRNSNIEINIIKNDITKKVIIKSNKENKEKNINKIINQSKEIKPKLINSVKKEINNDTGKKSIIIDIGKVKKSTSDKKKKIYDITVDEISTIEDRKTINKEKEKIPKNSPRRSERIKINENINEKLKTEININNTKIIKNDTNIKNIKPNSIYKSVIINNSNNLNEVNKANKINKVKLVKVINPIKDDNTNKNNQTKEKITKIEEKKEDISKGKNIKQPQNDTNLVKQVIKRYEDSPPKEIKRSNSKIFSKNNESNSESIFNKIISSFENKNDLFTTNYIESIPLDTGIHFNPNDFKYLGVIGEGEFGKIYLVQWINNDNQFYAMKLEKFKDYEDTQKAQCINGIIKNFISKTSSNGVVKIYGDISIKRSNIYYYYTLMEKCERDVEQECIIRNKYLKFFTEKNLIDILCQLILTCSSLQKNNICHGDIKPQNILILNGSYKLSDFGEVKIIPSDGLIEQEIGGTELYMSPILFFAMKKKEKTIIHNAYKSDVFSLALCMLLMATFNYQSIVQIRELVDMNKIKIIVKEFLSKRYSENLIEFLLWMLEIDENNRPDFIELESKLIKKESNN